MRFQVINLDKPRVESKPLKLRSGEKKLKFHKAIIDKDSVYEGINNYGYPFRTYRLIRLRNGVKYKAREID